MLGLALGAALVACGGGTDRSKAQVRLVNASGGYAALDLRVDGSLRQGNVAYGQTAATVEIDPDEAASSITSSGSTTALVSFTPALEKRKHYSVLAFGAAGALRQLLLGEDVSAPDSGYTRLRIVNAAPDAGDLDIYLTGSADDLAVSVPLHEDAAYGEAGGFVDVTSGTYRLRVAAANSKTDLRLDVAALGLATRQVATLVLTPSRSGALVQALLITQQGAITRLDGAHARVRVVAGVADSGAVSVTLGGVALLNGVGSPAVGSYALAAAGTPPLAISVNGASVGAPATVLAVGGDYTLLVYGPLATPAATWIEDVNTLPSVAGATRVRLVNATAGIAAPAAMTVDFEPVASGVAAGAASAYAQVDANATARISVTAGGLAAPLFSVTEQALAAGANYSVFVIGAQGATVGIVRKDR